MYFANCYHHSGKPHEVVMDVILGTWTRIDHPDHITFGCRFDVVDGRTVATLVEPVFGRSGAPIDGRLISKAEAPTHPRLAEFRSVADFALVNDPTVHPHRTAPRRSPAAARPAASPGSASR